MDPGSIHNVYIRRKNFGVTHRKKPNEDTGKDCSDIATSQGYLEGQGGSSPRVWKECSNTLTSDVSTLGL